MTVTLLAVAVLTALAAAALRRPTAHRVLGAASLVATVAALPTLPSVAGDDWLALMSIVAGLGLSGFGVVMLRATGHPRRIHRHIIYTGYGVTFNLIALCWVAAGARPGHDRDAIIASAACWVLGSLAIYLYRIRATRAP